MALFFFFFKQKTAYEMRISDWSSDVCSSDLSGGGRGGAGAAVQGGGGAMGRGVGKLRHQGRHRLRRRKAHAGTGRGGGGCRDIRPARHIAFPPGGGGSVGGAGSSPARQSGRAHV